MDLKLHDIVEMKKEHPCGRRPWGGLPGGKKTPLRPPAAGRCCG